MPKTGAVPGFTMERVEPPWPRAVIAAEFGGYGPHVHRSQWSRWQLQQRPCHPRFARRMVESPSFKVIVLLCDLTVVNFP
jgi:hypothetical protein